MITQSFFFRFFFGNAEYINREVSQHVFSGFFFLITFLFKMPTHFKEEIIIDYEDISHQRRTQEFFRHLPEYTKEYIISLFPIASWLHRYNLMVDLFFLKKHFESELTFFAQH